MMTFAARAVVVLALSAFVGCAPPGEEAGLIVAPTAATSEGFEAGTKTSYAAANVTLASGSWSFDDAVIGTLSSDVKNGSHAARIRNSGVVAMSFDRSSAGTVSISHATYGSDSSGSWGLFASRDQGATWTQVGSTKTTSASALSTSTFTVNVSGTIRFAVRKTDGGANRIDLDDISITDYSGGGSTGGTAGASVSVHTTLGLPSAATTRDWNDYLSVKSDYVVAYNSGRKVPNWVSWELNSSYFGSADRTNSFRPDDTLPASMPQATLADYSGSGYDRGHMCPSGDRTLTSTANAQTFYLTNMVPQAGHNNRGPWEKLETYARSLASSGKELFIISGGVFTGTNETIGDGVSVPDQTWKVMVVLDGEGQGAADVTTSTRVIGVIMPNSDSQISASDSWQSYRVSVRTIENETGLNFLSDVPVAVQNVVETRVDNQ